MILEILLPLPINDKTFFYKEKFWKNKPKIGQIVSVKFRNKEQIGIVLKTPKVIDLDKKLSEIEDSSKIIFLMKKSLKV